MTRTYRSRSLSCLLLIAVGCSSAESSEIAMSGEAGEDSTELDGVSVEPAETATWNEDSAFEPDVVSVEPAETAIWNEDSAFVSLAWTEWLDGSFQFERAREDLSNAQLKALGDVQLTTDPECVQDGPSGQLVVTDSSGLEQRYLIGACDPEDDLSVDIDSVFGLINTLDCRRLKDSFGGGLPDALDAPLIQVGNGCGNGIWSFLGDAEQDWMFRVQVETVDVQHEFRVEECFNLALVISLYDSAGGSSWPPRRARVARAPAWNMSSSKRANISCR